VNITKTISSTQNPLVKKILLLKEKSRERKKTGLFVIEGQRELILAQKGNYQFEQFLVCEGMFSKQAELTLGDTPIVSLTKPVYQKIAHRGSTEGIIAIAKEKSHHLGDIFFPNSNPLILVAEALEKPGNIGALLRTADAANVDAVLIANPKSDLYNPNIIRSSIGCVFTRQIYQGTSEEIIAFLQNQFITIYCAALSASKAYTSVDFKKATAIVVGTEAKGLTSVWLDKADDNIVIPMAGEIDSMNVSVSAAILIFEAKRQRGY